MFNVEWDKVGERFYETGVDRGMLYVQKDGKDVASGKGSIDISAITGMCSLRIHTESSGSTIDVLEITYLRLAK